MKFTHILPGLKIIFLLLFFTVTSTLLGQNSNFKDKNSSNGSVKINDRSLTDRQIDYIQKTYAAEIETPKELINGKEYESYYIRSQSKPLLFVGRKRTATIITPSRRYSNLILQYDTFLDEVVYTDTSRTINYRFPEIALNKDIVQGFNLYFEDDSLLFRYFRQPECIKRNIKEGFYEVAYQGKSEYIVRHASSYYVREGRNEYKYSPENYISVGDVFYRIKSKAGVLKLFADKSVEVKKFLHINRIRIRQAGKNEFVSIVKFYDSLTKPSVR
jgi:hypothetical protein